MDPKRKSESGQPRVSLMKLSKWIIILCRTVMCMSFQITTLTYLKAYLMCELQISGWEWTVSENNDDCMKYDWKKPGNIYCIYYVCETYSMLFVYLGCLPYRYCKSVPGSELCWPVRKPLAVALVLEMFYRIWVTDFTHYSAWCTLVSIMNA